jgi:hypothetical protein
MAEGRSLKESTLGHTEFWANFGAAAVIYRKAVVGWNHGSPCGTVGLSLCGGIERIG